MPEISRFYGMVIKMYFIQAEHAPPHFHVIYGEYTGAIEIANGMVLDGDLPAKSVAMVQEWLQSHRVALMEIWKTQSFRKLPPLV